MLTNQETEVQLQEQRSLSYALTLVGKLGQGSNLSVAITENVPRK